MSERERMAAAQARLLEALLEEGPAPEGFDRRDLAFAGQMLREKRARVAQRVAQRRACPEAPAVGRWARIHAALRRRWTAWVSG